MWRSPECTIRLYLLDKRGTTNVKTDYHFATLVRSDSANLERKKEFSLSKLLNELIEHYSEMVIYQEAFNNEKVGITIFYQSITASYFIGY